MRRARHDRGGARRRASPTNVVIVTAADASRGDPRGRAGRALIEEPFGRNTAAAIGLAAAILVARDPDAVLAVLPADQHVTDRAGMVARARDRADRRGGDQRRDRDDRHRADPRRDRLRLSRARRSRGARAPSCRSCASSRSRIARPPSVTSPRGATCGTRASSARAPRRLLDELAHAPAGDRRGRDRDRRTIRRPPRERYAGLDDRSRSITR